MSTPGTRRTVILKVVAPIVAGVVVVGAAGAVAWSNASTAGASATYRQHRQALDARLRTASQEGYTSQDLAPIMTQLRTLDGTREPWWIPVRPGFYEGEAAQAANLEVQLDALERQLLGLSQADASKQLGDAKTVIAQAKQNNAADPDVQALQQRLDAATKAQGAAHMLKDYRAVAQQGRTLVQDAGTLLTQTQQENQAVQQAGQQVIAQANGNLGAVQQSGNQALAAARNDASVAAYMNLPGPFKGYDVIQRAYSRLEKFAGMIGSGDINVAGQGTAAAQRYGAQIHDALIHGLPGQAVIVSFQDQHLWAYQNSQVVLDTPVTTGIRGVSDFGTDFGPMKVLWKSHPWKMHSPWPKSSPYWYPDTDVQWTTFFTRTGESIHDASWEPDSALGPGSQFNPS